MEDESNIPTKKRRVKPKVVKEWDEDEIFKLIAAVEDYPCIWNAGEEMYHNKSARENAWQTIGDIFNGKYDTSDMSAKWSNLRIQYRTAAARAKSKSGQGVVENPKWKYFSALSFVGRAEDEQTQATVSNLPLDISSSDSLDCPPKLPTQQSTTRRPHNTHTQTQSAQIAETMREAVEVMRERNLNVNEPNGSFANYLLSELRTLSEDGAASVRNRVTLFFLQCIEEERKKSA